MSTVQRQRIALILALGAIAVVCLPPSTGPLLPPTFDPCLVCGTNGLASALLNVVLYVPFGAALWSRFRRLLPVLGAAVATSLLVEVAQLAIPGRHAALSDLLANALGALLGAGLAVRPRRWLLPEGRGATAAALCATGAVLASMILTAWLLAPVAPDGAYHAQWTPSGRNRPAYDGRVLDARIGDVPLPIGQVDAGDRVRDMLLARAPVTVRFVAGSPPTRLLPVFRLVAGEYDAGDEALQVGIDATHLVLTPRFRADEFRLSRPEVQLEAALAHVRPGDTLTVTLRGRAEDGHEVTLDGRREVVGFTVGRGWSLLYATGLRSARLLRAMEHLWLGALGFLVAWYAGRPARSGAALLACALAAAVIPQASSLLASPATEFLALVGGGGLGLVARRGADRWVARVAQRRDGAQTS